MAGINKIYTVSYYIFMVVMCSFVIGASVLLLSLCLIK